MGIGETFLTHSFCGDVVVVLPIFNPVDGFVGSQN